MQRCLLRFKGGGLARSSPRPQCPQLPPIAGLRLIPNDRRLVPTPDVSRCSKMVLVQKPDLLDHLVGAGEQHRWNFEA
jgi:hypothetical protein